MLGQGGFGIVYDATDLRLNRRYAVKSIITSSATAQKQVLEEANILAGHARHFPFMPEIYDTWSERDRTFLVMEYVAGPTLADMLENDGRWTAAQVEQFLRIILADLAQLHAAGIIHRDLKPANIKRTAKGTFVLLDFGISKQSGGTLAGARALSPHYSPPEQMRGHPTDERSDLYSLAATAYHLLTGAPPDPSTNRVNLPLVPPQLQVADVSTTLNDTLLTMLELDPDQRPTNARAASALLDQAEPAVIARATISNQPLVAAPAVNLTAHAATGETLADSASRPINRRRLAWIAALVGVIAVGGLIGVLLLNRTAAQTAQNPTAPAVQPISAVERAAVIEPVAAGEYMVLVAQLESLGAAQRDVQRFIADDLRRTLVEEVPLSNIRVRTATQIVTSDAAAQELAQSSGATVIVWGNYDATTVDLVVQIGTTAAFPGIQIAPAVLC